MSTGRTARGYATQSGTRTARRYDFCRIQALTFRLYWSRKVSFLMPDWTLPHINREQCTLCGACVEQCPGHAVEMTADGPSFVEPFNCTYCALCEDVCPQGAITCTYAILWDSAPTAETAETAKSQKGIRLRPRRTLR